MPSSVVKARIRNLENGDEIVCMFNPNEYSFSKSSDWKEAKNRGGNVPTLEFTGGKPISMKLQLFFDTHEAGDDVRDSYTNALWDLVRVDPSHKDARTQKSTPPTCEFQWGEMWSFKAVVTNISQKFTLFLSDGTPTRATVDLTLMQAEDEDAFPFQNPTSGGAAGHRTYVVREGDSLDGIAYREYGESRHWRFIAESNDIDDPLTLRPGRILALPPLDHG
jgi:hypothetical protein